MVTSDYDMMNMDRTLYRLVDQKFQRTIFNVIDK